VRCSVSPLVPVARSQANARLLPPRGTFTACTVQGPTSGAQAVVGPFAHRAAGPSQVRNASTEVVQGADYIGVVAGAALLLWPQPSRSTSASAGPTLVPMFSAHAAGVQLQGEL